MVYLAWAKVIRALMRRPLSQEQRFIRSDVKDFKELELNTGLHHGFLFKALKDWIVPAKNWVYRK
ncbi:hypothetical protein BOQ64_22965 [Chryseobacterium sp. CH25]|nr:hypothetical protein BOQ64_22965 [Chryseobacterium sp. CH25]